MLISEQNVTLVTEQNIENRYEYTLTALHTASG
jgi:hypothetical protein